MTNGNGMNAPTTEQANRDLYERYLDEFPVDTQIPLSLAEWRKSVEQ